MEKYQNKYRNGTFRAQWWDYGNNAAYFITICTADRMHYFGAIENQHMQLSEIGKIAETLWFEIPEHFPFAKTAAFVVMPNHVHGIIIIDKSTDNYIEKTTFEETKKENPGGFAGDKNPMLNENLSRIVRWYKGRCSFEIRKTGAEFKWQSRFHDHIIRDQSAFQRISDYIENNPTNWKEDKFH